MTPTDRFLRASLVLAALLASAALWWPAPAHAARIKEVASVQGVRTNQLVGYGLVVGLDGTGDQNTQAPFATQSLLALLQQMGVTVPPGQNMQLKNLATVMVTAQLPAFAQPGQTIDVNVSSLANAKSLRGGTLIATPLKGADGQIYAMAQGNLIVGGAGASAAGSKVQINHLSAGRIPEGATVERAVATPMNQGDSIQLDLNSSDYATAREVVKAINARMGPGTADAIDGRVIRVRMPDSADARVSLHGRDPEPRRQALDAGRQGGDQRPHRLGGDEPGGDAGGLRGGARQPLGDDQHHAVGQPAGAVLAHRPDRGHREGRHHHHPAGRRPGADGARAPSSPTSSRRSTPSARRRRTCSRSCRR